MDHFVARHWEAEGSCKTSYEEGVQFTMETADSERCVHKLSVSGGALVVGTCWCTKFDSAPRLPPGGTVGQWLRSFNQILCVLIRVPFNALRIANTD